MNIAFDFWAVFEQWPLLLTGVAWTLGLTSLSGIFGLSLGVVMAWARLEAVRPNHDLHRKKISRVLDILDKLILFYVELIRNTPFIVQLFFIFFGLPALGLRLSAEVASVLAMIINLSAYSCEIVRAGLEATPPAQVQAGESLGLKPVQIFKHVVLPPALFKVWPALVSQIIIVMLGSAVCGQISTEELSYSANLIQSRNFRAFESFITAAFIYLLLSIAIRWLLNKVGRQVIFKGMVSHD